MPNSAEEQLATPAPQTGTPEVKPSAKQYRASIYPDTSLPTAFVGLIQELELSLHMPVWFIIQNGEGAWSQMGFALFEGFKKSRNSIGSECALIVDSPGGDAHVAYRIARIFQRRTDRFVVVVPQYAKSAATLLALGASELMLARDAELGPLDVQMFDVEREDVASALDAVQALERLNASAMTAIDQMMPMLVARTGKKIETLLPMILDYSASFVRPLLENIDTIDYAKKSRELKVAAEYAVRLMRGRYKWSDAKRIANALVAQFTTHAFVIDREEASAREIVARGEYFGLGLKVEKPTEEQEEIMNRLLSFLDDLTAIGRLEEVRT